jgi:hypothetical protein
MKRFWLVLLSLGLVLAASASAFALDVKFSGDFYVAGMYLDKTKLVQDTAADGPSTAFYYQRLRVRTDFVVSPGLTLITRFDAMERIWGGQRSDPGKTSVTDSAGTRAENENIAFDWAYINYVSPIGIFEVGLMEDGRTGTVFGDSYTTSGRIRYYSIPFGPFTLKADITKVNDQSDSAVYSSTATDADDNKYGLEGVYTWKDGRAGMKVTYYDYSDNSPDPASVPAGKNYKKQYFLFTPYAVANIGPVALQAEVNYATGKVKNYSTSTADVDLTNLSAFLDATATFSPVYFGGTFAYISGTDPGNTGRQTGGVLNGGQDWNPCLIMFNYYDRTNWVGNLGGYGTNVANVSSATSNGGPMGTDPAAATAPGAWFGQGRIGVKPTADLDIVASVAYASADKKPVGVLSNTFGYEVDLTGTYKITNNLSYMLGAGYWFVGNYYKSNSDANELKNDYMVINKLTLTF